MLSMRLRRFAAAALTAALAVPLLPSSAPAVDREIQIRDNYFSKEFIVVTEGDTVTWTNTGSFAHTVVSYTNAPEAFDSSPNTTDGNCATLLEDTDCIEPDESFSYTFTTPGKYDFYCKVTGHADTAQRPDPSNPDARSQPCGMCARIRVKKPADQQNIGPDPDEEPPQTDEPTEEPTSTRSASPSPSETDSGIAIPTSPAGSIDDADGGGARVGLALGGIVVLAGAGWFVWRRFLAGA